MRKEGKKQEAQLLDKLNKGQHLDRGEISNLAGILLMEEKYDKGIDLFEQLERSAAYANERDKIYFVLSEFYI
jgi:hypothetical protein